MVLVVVVDFPLGRILLLVVILHVLIMSGAAILPVNAWQEWRTSTPTLSSGPMASVTTTATTSNNGERRRLEMPKEREQEQVPYWFFRSAEGAASA